MRVSNGEAAAQANVVQMPSLPALVASYTDFAGAINSVAFVNAERSLGAQALAISWCFPRVPSSPARKARLRTWLA